MGSACGTQAVVSLFLFSSFPLIHFSSFPLFSFSLFPFSSLPHFLFSLLASQSDAHRIAPHRDPNPSNPIPLIALKQERPMMWHIFEKEIVQGPQKECSQVKNKN